MRKRRAEPPRGGGVPIGVVVVLVLALVGVVVFFVADRDHRASGPSDPFEALIAEAVDQRIVRFEEENARAGLLPTPADRLQVAREEMIRSTKARIRRDFPELERQIRSDGNAAEAARRTKAILADVK